MDTANTSWGREPCWKVDSFGPFNTSVEVEDPFLSAKHILVTPSDTHLCILLTRNDPSGGTMERIESPFLNTLKYLHIRGPGAHVCSELFKTEGKPSKISSSRLVNVVGYVTLIWTNWFFIRQPLRRAILRCQSQ